MRPAPGHAVRVATAVPADAVAVLALQQVLFPGDPNVLAETDFGPLGPLVLIAHAPAGVAGYLALRDRPMRPWTSCDFVGVAGEARGAGVGAALMDAAIGAAARPFIRLSVRPSNTPARALYRRFGFVHVSTRQSNYDDGEAALVLMKWIGPRRLRSKRFSGTTQQ